MDSIGGITSLRLLIFVICCMLSDMQYNYDGLLCVSCLHIEKNFHIIKCVLCSYLNFLGETKSTEKCVHIHYLNSSHACHATQNHVNIFLFESRSNT